MRTAKEWREYLSKYLKDDDVVLLDYWDVDTIIEQVDGVMPEEDSEWFDTLPEEKKKEFAAGVLAAFDNKGFPSYEDIYEEIAAQFPGFRESMKTYYSWLEEKDD